MVERKNTWNPEMGPRWYAKAVQDRTVEFEDFVTHMSEHNSPYSRGVIHGVLIDMLACMQELVLDGKSVRLGELGLFSIGMESKGADSQEKFAASLIKGVHLNVRNTKTWSNAELRKRCRFEELADYSRATASDATATATASDGEQV